MWNIFKKSKEQQIEELEALRLKANVEAEKIFVQIYCLFKERINELKEGDNFILFQEEPIKICDDKELNKSLLDRSIYHNSKYWCSHIPELRIVVDIETITAMNIYTKKYYIFTIKMSHDDVIEIYDIKFIVHPSPKEINNGNEICVTIHAVDKNIYKLI